MIFLLFFQVEYQAINRVYSDSTQELVLYLTIPARKLQRVAADDGFYARYEIQLTVFDKAARQLTGDYWRRRTNQDDDEIADSVKIKITKESDSFILKILDLHGGEIFSSTQKLIQVRNLANIYWSVHNDTLHLTFTVFNQQGMIDSIVATISQTRKIIPLRKGTYGDSVAFDVAGLPIDDYQLKLEMYAEQGKVDESVIPIKVSRPFYLDDATWSA
jgi:hypothetical protein